MPDKNIEIIKAIKQTGRASTAPVKNTQSITEGISTKSIRTGTSSMTFAKAPETNKKEDDN